MADITLINLNLLYIDMGDRIDAEVHTPLGPLYIISALEREGFDVDFRDYQLAALSHDIDPFDINYFLSFSYGASRIVGLSCMANLLPFTLLAAEALKKEDPRRIIVLGGVGSFGVEAKILERFSFIDVIVRGEAEETAPELLRKLLAGLPLDDVAGIYFRKGSTVCSIKRGRISNLNAIPYPAYHRIDCRNYDGFGLISSRGCPYDCAFCTVTPIWGNIAKFRSAENIIGEIEYLRSLHPIDEVLFQDEYFVSTHNQMAPLFKAFTRMQPQISWRCFGRINLVDEHLMNDMAAAHCDQIRFGVESGSDRILSLVSKGFTYQDALAKVRMAVQIFNSVEAFFIWGFPFETLEDFFQTAAAMVQFAELGVRVLPSLFSPLPQSRIYQNYTAGLYQGRLEFCKELIPAYVISGHEEVTGFMRVSEKHQCYYNLIVAHPDIFPGHYLFNPDENVLPKFQVLRNLGFY